MKLTPEQIKELKEKFEGLDQIIPDEYIDDVEVWTDSIELPSFVFEATHGGFCYISTGEHICHDSGNAGAWLASELCGYPSAETPKAIDISTSEISFNIFDDGSVAYRTADSCSNKYNTGGFWAVQESDEVLPLLDWIWSLHLPGYEDLPWRKYNNDLDVLPLDESDPNFSFDLFTITECLRWHMEKELDISLGSSSCPHDPYPYEPNGSLVDPRVYLETWNYFEGCENDEDESSGE